MQRVFGGFHCLKNTMNHNILMTKFQNFVTGIRTLAIVGIALGGCSSTPKTKPGVPAPVTVERSGQFELIPIAGKFVAKRAKLDNGLKLIIVEDSSSPTFAYQTWFNVGSRNEVFGKTGLAHLFEHMMFKGTK